MGRILAVITFLFRVGVGNGNFRVGVGKGNFRVGVGNGTFNEQTIQLIFTLKNKTHGKMVIN